MKLRVYTVREDEKGRIDKFIDRTMGGYTEENLAYLVFFNPDKDITNVKVGQKFRIPNSVHIDRIRWPRMYSLWRYM